MKESQIQAILERLIKEDRLFNCIKNTDSIENLYKSLHNEDSLPSFSIDYFSRKKLISAAKNIASILKSVQVITTASKNISVDRKEKLFPDLVLLNQEEGKIVILEIKRSVKTARETLTEMLAYDHEIRNLLPFLSNFEILFCVVSTEYSTLLNHSITGLATWESKQILCLHVEESEKEELQIEIYIPPAWTSLGISSLPPAAISTLKIILYKRSDDEISQNAESAVFYAASLIAKEGDRNNSHGFVLVWRDCWKLEDLTGSAEYHLIVGFVNPYVFLPFAQSLGVIDAYQSPVGQHFLENGDNFRSYCCKEVFEKGLNFLEKFFHVEIEGFSDWNNDRSKPHEVYNPITLLCHRALPLRVELWGALGDFSREFIVHPGVEKYILSKFSGTILGCENPFIGIPLIDNISGARKLDERGFTCKFLFELGISLGSLSTLYNTASHSEENDLRNLPASITWYTLDIQSVLLELVVQYSSSSELNVPPPVMKFHPSKNFEEALETNKSLINWIYTEFLGRKGEIHAECFIIGLDIHPLMDEYFSCTLPEDYKKFIVEKVVASSTRLLKRIARECLSDYTSVESVQNAIDVFSNEYLSCNALGISEESLISLVDDIPNEKHLSLYHNVLMELLDSFLLPVNYRVPPSQNLSEYKHLDWVWIREEILRFRERGIEFPALKANLMEQIGIVDIGKEVYASSLKKIDFRYQFVFITSSNAMDMAFIRDWGEVIH